MYIVYIVYTYIAYKRYTISIRQSVWNKQWISIKKRGGEGVIFYPFLPMTFISPAESNLNVKCKKKRQKQTRMLLEKGWH